MLDEPEPEPPLVGRFDSGTPGCPGNPFAPAEVDEEVPVAAFEGSLIFAPEPPELLESEDFELDAPELLAEEPELAGLLVPILPQAARAKTHAKGMIQFFIKDSLKERKETAYHFSTAVKCMTGALNRKNLQKEVPICLCKNA